MNRKLPIRTYERKRCKEITISIERLHISTASSTSNVPERAPLKHASNAIETNEPSDNSLHYDPFDTTFDRFARRARYEVSLPFSSSVPVFNQLHFADLKCKHVKHIRKENPMSVQMILFAIAPHRRQLTINVCRTMIFSYTPSV